MGCLVRWRVGREARGISVCARGTRVQGIDQAIFVRCGNWLCVYVG